MGNIPTIKRLRKPTPQKLGKALEDRVAAILIKEGTWGVKKNVLIKDRNGNRSEIDVQYGYGPFKRYIECKAYHLSGKPVPLSDVAKFKEVLTQNKISHRKGMLVTTSIFSPRCQHTGIRLVDG